MCLYGSNGGEEGGNMASPFIEKIEHWIVVLKSASLKMEGMIENHSLELFN